MKFIFLHLTSSKKNLSKGWFEEASRLYANKISKFISFELKPVSSRKIPREDQSLKKKAESEEILALLKEDDLVVLFEEKGRHYTSPEFARVLQQILSSGKKRCVWIIGGAFGVSEEIQKQAHYQVCLAPFVLNHQVAQIVAMEQLYRAFTLMKGLPYHNGD